MYTPSGHVYTVWLSLIDTVWLSLIDTVWLCLALVCPALAWLWPGSGPALTDIDLIGR